MPLSWILPKIGMLSQNLLPKSARYYLTGAHYLGRSVGMLAPPSDNPICSARSNGSSEGLGLSPGRVYIARSSGPGVMRRFTKLALRSLFTLHAVYAIIYVSCSCDTPSQKASFCPKAKRGVINPTYVGISSRSRDYMVHYGSHNIHT